MAKQGSIRRDAGTGQFVIGRTAFSRISAVEGIRMPREMKADFDALDASGAPADQRRAVLVGKYGNRKG
jgi:hypothetical protein